MFSAHIIWIVIVEVETSVPSPEEENRSTENVEEKKEVEEIVKEPTKEAPAEESAATKSVSSNAFASGANMNSANVLTDRPTSRVSRPPGGHTSIRLW